MSAQCLVLGAGMAGLSAAIYARLRGFDVLVLEQAETPGGKAAGIPHGEHFLDPAPSIIILTHIYEQLFRDAGRRMEDYLQFDRLNPFSRVMWQSADYVLDLPADREECLLRLADAFPEDGRALRDLLEKLDATTPAVEKTIFAGPVDRWWQLLNPGLMKFGTQFDPRLSYKELIDSLFRAPLLKAFLYGFPSYSGQTYHSKAVGALLIPYYMITRGVWYPRGGVSAIPRALRKLAEELGVEFRFGERVVGAEASGRNLTRVKLESGEAIGAEKVICTMDRLTFESLLGRTVKSEPSDSYFTVQWVLKRRLPGLSHHTLLVPQGFEEGFTRIYDHALPPEPPIIYLNAPEPSGEQMSLLSVVPVPPCREGLDWEREALLMRRRILEGMAQFGLDFAEEEIVFSREQSPSYFQQRHGNWKGALYGPVEGQRLWGILPLSNRDSELRNLFYAGCSVQPGAGLPMVTLSGKFAAGLL